MLFLSRLELHWRLLWSWYPYYNFLAAEFVPTETPVIVGPVDPLQPTTAPDLPINPNPGNIEDPTWPTTEWPITEWPTDDGGEALQENAAGQTSKRGYYVAIGVGGLLIIIIILIVIGIVVYKMRQRKRQQKGKTLKDSVCEYTRACMSMGVSMCANNILCIMWLIRYCDYDMISLLSGQVWWQAAFQLSSCW